MIALRPHDHAALSAIVAAGPDGMRIDGRDVSISSAILLKMAGFTTLDKSSQRVTATSQGRAFHFRSAA
jgi:hypothetical protein